MAKDYYQILGVARGASAEEIKQAFRKLAHQHHPDKGGDEAKFKEANEAYQTLSDSDKRARYDQFGTADGPPGFGGFGTGGFDASNFADLGDIFGSFFGGGARDSRGADLATDVHLSFSEAVFGVSKELSLNKTNNCDRCGGQGAEPGSKLATCKICAGRGVVNKVQRTILGSMQVRAACDACHGKGEIPEKPCTTCRGEGVIRNRKTLRVDIPAGVDNGMQVKIRGEGESIGGRGQAGDLFVRLHVAADRRFRREGTTLYSEKKIGFTQAAIGDTVQVETVDGPESLKIPAGTQSGDELRLRGKGIPTGRGRGDQIVIVKVVTPTRLDKKSRDILSDLNLRED